MTQGSDDSIAGRSSVALALTALAVMLAMLLSQADRAEAGYRPCGQLHDGHPGKTWVGAKKTSCRKAHRILSYWLNGRGVKWHRGGDYYTLRRYPGWKCGSGAGAGTCVKGRKAVEYNSYRPYIRSWGYRVCGKVPSRSSSHFVAQKLSCRKARKIVNYWLRFGPGVTLHPDSTGGHYTLRRYRGWTCGDGAGGGACTKGRRMAGYNDAPPSSLR